MQTAYAVAHYCTVRVGRCGRRDLYASRRIEPLPDFARFYHFLDLALKAPAW